MRLTDTFPHSLSCAPPTLKWLPVDVTEDQFTQWCGKALQCKKWCPLVVQVIASRRLTQSLIFRKQEPYKFSSRLTSFMIKLGQQASMKVVGSTYLALIARIIAPGYISSLCGTFPVVFKEVAEAIPEEINDLLYNHVHSPINKQMHNVNWTSSCAKDFILVASVMAELIPEMRNICVNGDSLAEPLPHLAIFHDIAMPQGNCIGVVHHPHFYIAHSKVPIIDTIGTWLELKNHDLHNSFESNRPPPQYEAYF